jgi:hypothetical protein
MRVEGWDVALGQFVSSRLDTPFEWGNHDCCLFAADAAQVVTGRDFAAEVRGTYTSERSAARKIKEWGGLDKYVSSLLGDPIPSRTAKRGDVVMMHQDGQLPALGVCMGAKAAFAGPDGITWLPMADSMQCWEVK